MNINLIVLMLAIFFVNSAFGGPIFDFHSNDNADSGGVLSTEIFSTEIFSFPFFTTTPGV